MSDPFIQLKNISKSYVFNGKPLLVLDQIHLDIKAGSFLSIVGLSGAGKSTLLHLMGLLDTPTKGDLSLLGYSILTLSDREKAFLRNTLIGFIFQSYHLISELTVLENVMLPAQLLRSQYQTFKRFFSRFFTEHDLPLPLSHTAIKEKAESLLKRVNLQDRQAHKPGELSGGEQQRACLCRALVNDPKLILADEPTGNLDSHNAQMVEELLETMTREKKASLILVTHNETLAKRAEQTISLLDGEMV